jgi:hypothetical protein
MATAFAARMSNLDGRHRAVSLQERGDSRQIFNVLILPNTQVAGSNPTASFHRRRFSDHQTSAANSPAPEMNQMPIVRKSVITRVLAHWRNSDPVPKRDFANLQRREEA